MKIRRVLGSVKRFLLRQDPSNMDYWIIKKSGLFDSSFYRRNYPDFTEQEKDPILHFIRFGASLNYNPSESFSTKYYMEANKDVKEMEMNPLLHYINHGFSELRRPRFDVSQEDYIPYKHLGAMDVLVRHLLEHKRENNYSFFNIISIFFNIGIKESFLNCKNIALKRLIFIRPSGKNKKIYKYKKPVLSKEVQENIKSFEYKPKISVLLPVYNVDPRWLKAAVLSVQNQWYENWEICLVDDCSSNKKTVRAIGKIKDSRIKVKRLNKNGNISYASNKALKMASGDFIALLDHDDEITVDALYEVVSLLNTQDADFIYSDEDKLTIQGLFVEPHFKPDFSPDMFLSQNYISHLSVIRRSLVEEVGGFAIGLEGAQDYDLYLKVFERTDKIEHISKVLYHWRKVPGSTADSFNEKSYAQGKGRKAIEAAVNRRNIPAEVLNGKYPGTYRVKYKLLSEPLVSIIIPFKDKPELLKKCIESIIYKSTYKNYEIIGISNNSEEDETFLEMKRLSELDNRVSFYEYNIPFNYSKINNYAVEKFAKGSQIVLLNNDIEVLSPDWIESLLEFSQRDDVGAVGVKLYYPDMTIQHAGVILGLGGVAGHSHKYFDSEDPGYFYRPWIVQNLSAVTAACLMIKKNRYNEVGGFEEKNLPVSFNDVDFCLRLMGKGYVNVFTPYAELIHHESKTRGLDTSEDELTRVSSEIGYFNKYYAEFLNNGDRYYNSNLAIDRENFSLK